MKCSTGCTLFNISRYSRAGKPSLSSRAFKLRELNDNRLYIELYKIKDHMYSSTEDFLVYNDILSLEDVKIRGLR